MSTCKPVETSVDPNKKLGDSKEGGPIDTNQYLCLVGQLIYLSHSRPDIAFAISLERQFMHVPYMEHLEATGMILRYLKSSLGKGMLFIKGEQQTIEVYIDAN